MEGAGNMQLKGNNINSYLYSYSILNTCKQELIKSTKKIIFTITKKKK